MFQFGYIALKREICEFGWYHNSVTFHVFLHLLLNANFSPCHFENICVERGQLVTSIAGLSAALGLSNKQIRTALDHLETTNDIQRSPTNRYTLITILSYDKYVYSPSEGQTEAKQTAYNRQTDGKRGADEGQQYNNDNNNEEWKNNKKYGRYSNIYLREAEYQKLKMEFSDKAVESMIEEMSCYLEANGKKYLNYEAALRSWLIKREQSDSSPSDEIDTLDFID